MPLFAVTPTTLSTVDQTNFSAEKDLQTLIEKNLPVVFGCRFVATEFPTGVQHSGRIDTLALSEDNNPVILEYKKVESSDLINQSLFYLSWIQDHRGDFEIAAQKELGTQVVVDWSDIRVICLAPNYKRYDLHAVQVMGANLELWTYRLFENDALYLEEVFKKSVTTTAPSSGKGLTAGQKAALSRKTGSYTVAQHFKGKPKNIQDLARSIQEFLLGLDPAMEEVPKKLYLAYKISQNIACMEIQKQRVLLFVKLDPKKVAVTKNITRDVTSIGHFGTGSLELSVRTSQDLDLVKPLLEQAYQKVGG
jgi:predicted transport protein